MPFRTPDYSMFAETPAYETEGGNTVFGLRIPTVSPHPTDEFVEVGPSAEGRINRVADALLGQSRLWWAIADLNDVVDPLTALQAGDTLRVPDASRLRR